ncbi:MAG: cytochrome P450 [bacterium]|nr:cytochrome P450 [bacterium]MCY3891334.1 cytochrome P450 [bacterium]
MAEFTLTRFDDVRDGYRQKGLKQALYDAAGVIMADTLLTLWGDDHRRRRRLENRLFRRETFEHYERDLLPIAVDAVLDPAAAAGQGDVVPLARRIVVNLTAAAAGVDYSEGTVEETDRLYSYAVKFSEGATAVHSTRDPEELRTEVAEALERWDEEFFAPSLARRTDLFERFVAGEISEDDLPRDVLTVLVRNQDSLDLPRDVVRREVAFYMLAGMHSTGAATTHAVHGAFGWFDDHPDDRARMVEDPVFLQHCVHESMRLHPASPVAGREAVEPVTLRDGTEMAVGDTVMFDLWSANRDTEVFGADADSFNPLRTIRDDVPRWGHTFGGGRHACIGMELDGGVPADENTGAPILLGTVALILRGLLARGAQRDPDNPPQQDPNIARVWWGTYPVLF